VRGKDIAEVVKATRWIFTAGRQADTPAPPDPGAPQADLLPLWLIAYFGTGPSFPGFGRVQAAEVRGQTVRVTYFRARSNKTTSDRRHYYLWVPLGRDGAGTDVLELFDADRKQVTLLRHVAVARP
jgi:hypothetical protein